MSDKNNQEKQVEAEKTVTLSLSELEAMIAKHVAEAQKNARPIPAQGISGNTDPNEDQIVKVEVPEGWGLFKCPKNLVPQILAMESIVEPGKPMYIHVSDNPVATGAADVLLFRRRLADHDAMNKRASDDAGEMVKMWEHQAPAGENVHGVARVQSLETGEVIVEGRSGG